MVSVAKIWLISACFVIKGGKWLFPLTNLTIKQVQSGEFAVAYSILGQPPRLAISLRLSLKEYYRLVKTKAVQLGLTNKWLKAQGLVFLKDQWIKSRYPSG